MLATARVLRFCVAIFHASKPEHPISCARWPFVSSFASGTRKHARGVQPYHFGGFESSRWSLVVGVAGDRKFGLAWLGEESARENLEAMLGGMTRAAIEGSPTTGTSLCRARARDCM